MHSGWTILTRRQDHLGCGAESGRTESFSVFVLLGKCCQSVPARGAVIFFELSSEPPPELLSESCTVLRGNRRRCGRYRDGNLGTEHENAVAMPERTNQIIPMSLFHSSSTGDSATVMLNPEYQSDALPGIRTSALLMAH
jgi:hypothetical protein